MYHNAGICTQTVKFEVKDMDIFLGALLIFCLRLTDVSMGTVRMILIIQGRKTVASCIGFFEVAIFIVAVGKVVGNLGNIWNLIGYAGGFAVGTHIGITLEGWIALGFQIVRVITQRQNDVIIKKLRDARFALTVVPGEGREGPVYVLFSVVRRARVKEFLGIVDEYAPTAFVTVEETKRTMHGYFRESKRK